MRRTELVVPFPISANAYWRTAVVKGRAVTYVSEEGKAYREVVAQLCAVAGVRRFEGGTSLRLAVFRPRASGDASNCVKVLEDALRQLAYVDDEQNIEVWVRRFDDPENPRAQVTVLEGVRFDPPAMPALSDGYARALQLARARMAAVRDAVKRQRNARAQRKPPKTGPRVVATPNVRRPR